MTGFAQRIDTGSYVSRQSNMRYAPFSRGAEESAKPKSRSGALAVLVALLLMSGVTIALAKGYASAVETYGGSPESVLSIAWVVQGAVALLCFILTVRWLRN